MDLVKMALNLGAVVAGITSIKYLVDHQSMDLQILPTAKTGVVIACGHSRAALDSKNLQAKQNDTLATYEKVRTVCKELATALENKGFKAVAVPAFLPIDMSEGKDGMVGPIDLRRAAVEAGVGSYGKSSAPGMKRWTVRSGKAATAAINRFRCRSTCGWRRILKNGAREANFWMRASSAPTKAATSTIPRSTRPISFRATWPGPPRTWHTAVWAPK